MQNYAEEKENNNDFSELIRFHPLKSFPALAICENNQGEKPEFYGVIGANKVTLSYKTKDEVIEAIESTGVKNYPQLCAIVSGYLDLITTEYLKTINKEKGE